MNSLSTFEHAARPALQPVNPFACVPPRPPPRRDLLLPVDPNRAALPKAHAEAIRWWVDRWRRSEPDALVLLAESGPSRAGRVARLRSLRDLLVRCGVHEHRVRYTGDRVRNADHLTHRSGPASPASMGSVCSSWLKVIPAGRAELAMQSIRSFFGHRAQSERTLCIVAS
jgi:hypothetical protein